ncbi:sugar kinase [Entomospira culicis]|uniref:Sugar kinase n=1 Tax=Entomospira culicis TaxID=2719989 RepID=A0A968GEL8_9SPIO|nr:sugar kinase [Entomospira culicis]NIZ18914.1 sugar kinase [Entomospira culicis]NIZ69129.1 sugar kinase [Entomospira culicis]WDI37715.1 sugar kinase [Entomospira culicis]WDI39343.1 sugar kinase [Entomospira culicis]
MKQIVIKSADTCKYDLVSLGEVMLRFDPSEGRIKTARSFKVWEGGGEYNVARGLKRCFGMRTAIVTGIPQNDVGLLLEDLIYQGGVDMSYVKWFKYDGVGRDVRVGLNFTERGFGVRGALGVSDRANSGAAKLKKGDIDWEKLFGQEGVRWFHCGGIYAALSSTTPEVIIEAMQIAKKYGTIISYDLNYRPSLWQAQVEAGRPNAAQEVNREIAKYVDVMIGNEEDFTASLGFTVEGLDHHIKGLDSNNFKKMLDQVKQMYPNFKAMATTLREVHTASDNDWAALLSYEDKFYDSMKLEHLAIFDRVGGGDSFASGLIYGFLTGKSPQEALNYGVAHGALAMTTPGDTSMASLKEVENLVKGGSARVAR